MADDPTTQNTYIAPGVQRVLTRGLSVLGDHRAQLEIARRDLISKQRDYYAGDQYAALNERRLDTLCRDNTGARTLPEHERQHAYSVVIGESVNYLASVLGAGFSLAADDKGVADLLNRVIEATDSLSSVTADGETVPATDMPLRDAMIAGDVPVLVGWDDLAEQPTIQLWESEAVTFDTDDKGNTVKVTLRFIDWLPDDTGVVAERLVTTEYAMAGNAAGYSECQAVTYVTDDLSGLRAPDTEPASTVWLGVGRIPWVLLRADREGMRVLRGKSLITPQVMETADRFNSVEQTGFLIARYNSHSNLVVIGDEVAAKASTGQTAIRKDIADVLTFPEGTTAIGLSLPTDPAMINHQREVLTDAMYAAFGLVRMDPSTLTGFGQISGYALEILNGKTDATVGRIARSWRKDWKALIDLLLDVQAWRGEGVTSVLTPTPLGPEFADVDPDDEVVVVPTGSMLVVKWWDVDPSQVFPNRKVAIKLGTGAVVDDVKSRDDFSAGLISRKEALRERGLTPELIDQIVTEVDEQDAAATVGTEGTGTELASAHSARLNASQVNDGAPAQGTVGGTLANANRTE